VGKLTDKDDPNFGFDPQWGEYKDMVAAGIIDPTKVVLSALAAVTSRFADGCSGLAERSR